MRVWLLPIPLEIEFIPLIMHQIYIVIRLGFQCRKAVLRYQKRRAILEMVHSLFLMFTMGLIMVWGYFKFWFSVSIIVPYFI